jgi:6-pyruvoyltetrahydropterin/6-carboxytetrahydropterin synthase
MAVEYIREYELKFYLNAQHFVVFNGHKGEEHPHTWEFTLTIEIPKNEIIPFSAFERKVDDYLAPYQNRVMNEVPPFDTVMPTLESMVEEFVGPLERIIAEAGGTLVRLRGSEGPTRSYMLRALATDEVAAGEHDAEEATARVIDGIVGKALD